MARYAINIRQMGTKSVLVEWPQRIDESILEDVITFKLLILERYKDEIVNHTPAYASLLIQFRDDIRFSIIQSELYILYSDNNSNNTIDAKTWHIPVCYHESVAVDFYSFAANGISHKELVDIHTGAEYRIYMIGFLPGFLYLGGLPDCLNLPRKSTPNLKTPKGAVAIGGQQTGIYPMESPGGWHIIGRTPLDFFDMESVEPTPITQGDKVKFYEISLDAYQILKSD